MGEAKVKRGRPAKAKTPVQDQIVSWPEGIIKPQQLIVPTSPKPHRRTLTIPKPQTVAQAKASIDTQDRDTKLKQLLKAISRDGALGNDRSLMADVDAIKRLFS